MNAPRLSLIISTRGRSNEILVLLDSLAAQRMRDFEAIFVDQNEDGRVAYVLEKKTWPFPITHLRRPQLRGASSGRNEGLKRAQGTFVGFPDDDCWYPPGLLGQAVERLNATGADFVLGRAADETGRSINGRFAAVAQPVSRANVWITSIEWMLFGWRERLLSLGGYNEALGVGSDTPWQAAEGQDLLLRALSRGMRAIYDPSLIGHHGEFNIRKPDQAMAIKGRNYARGMGYVLRIFDYSPLSAAYWCARSLAGATRALTKGNFVQSRYFLGVALGRLEGYLKYTL